MWYDILVFDYMYEWISINIKTTDITISDNTGNLTMWVYAYTNEILDIRKDKLLKMVKCIIYFLIN